MKKAYSYIANEQYMKLREYFRTKLLKSEKLLPAHLEDRLNVIISKLYEMISIEENDEEIYKHLKKNGIQFDGIKDLQEYSILFSNAWNNTRMVANGGFTPHEIKKKLGR